MIQEPALPSSARSARPVAAVAMVGFMGAGKSTVGQALASRLNWSFADIDRLIETQEGQSIEHIFKSAGETRFRELERSLLQQSLKSSAGGLVLALGGGAFAQAEVRDLLEAAHVPTVFLNASPEELFQRCEKPGVVRPLRGDLNQFRALYERRQSSYRKASLRIETEGKPIAEIVEEIIAGLELAPASGAPE
jgi:shikimate kinase